MTFTLCSIWNMLARLLGIGDRHTKQHEAARNILLLESTNLNFIELRQKEHGKLHARFSSQPPTGNLCPAWQGQHSELEPSGTNLVVVVATGGSFVVRRLLKSQNRS